MKMVVAAAHINLSRSAGLYKSCGGIRKPSTASSQTIL